jgi:nucleoside-diphosphate-sugar epimerase
MNRTVQRVLVTGGTGFIGGRLVERLVLEHRAQVRVLVRDFRRAVRVARFPVEMIGGDVTDAAALARAMDGCDLVVHCAVGNRGPAAEKKAATVDGTAAVAEAALAARVKRLVYLSTTSVYGLPGDGDLDESAPRRQTGDPYSDTKIEAEETVFRYHRTRGLPVVVLQPTIVYGPFSQYWTLDPINQLKRSRVVLVEGGSGFCNAVYVDDVVEAILLAAGRDEAVGEAFLISGDAPVTWRDFYAAFEGMLGYTSTVALSVAEIEALRAKQRRESRTIPQIMRVIRNNEYMRNRLLELPAVGHSFRILSSMTPAWARTRIAKHFAAGEKPSGSMTIPPEKPLGLPDGYRMEFHRARTRVRVDKARRLLGYAPAFDFQRGMQLTSAWVDWANLG